MKLSYEKSVLVATRQYENSRVTIGVSEVEVLENVTLESQINQIREFVNQELLNEIYRLKYNDGSAVQKRLDEEDRRLKKEEVLRKTYGL